MENPSLEALVQRLPPMLAKPLHEYLRETHPVVLLWRACETVELLLRLLVVLGVADLRRRGGLPANVLTALRKHIERPSLGDWSRMAEALGPTFSEGAFPEAEALIAGPLGDFLHGKGERRDLHTSFNRLRNHLAHGGGITLKAAHGFLEAWRQRFETLIAGLDWLGQVDLVVRRGDGLGLLRGLGPRPLPYKGSADLGRDDEVIAIRGPHRTTVWPLALFAPATNAGAPASSESLPQIYSTRGPVRLYYTTVGSDESSYSESDPSVSDAFLRIFRLDESDPATALRGLSVRDFESDLRRDATHRIGRERELETLLHLLRSAPGDAYWLAGGPGSGKSVLLASAATALLDDPPAGTVVLPYRFRRGDDRCSRERFARFLVERLLPVGTDRDPVALVPRALENLRGRRLVLLIDGLDEITFTDPAFAQDFPLAHRRPDVLWLCVGRQEPALVQAFSTCTSVFPDGLPPMSSDDVRAMILEKIGPLRTRLVRNDHEENDRVLNPFIERVTACAEGLPLYVVYVIGDILSGRLAAMDAGERLPPSLDAYIKEVLYRNSIGSKDLVATPIVTLLAAAHEPLGIPQIAEMLDRRMLAPPGRSPALAEKGLSAVASLLRRTTDPTGSEAYVLHHTTLREHMSTSESQRDALGAAEHFLSNLSAHPATGAFHGYVARHGIRHLLKAGRVADSVALLGRLDSDLRTVWLTRLVAAALDQCTSEEAGRVDSDVVSRRVLKLDDFPSLISGLRFLHRYHPTHWTEILDQCPHASWEIRYAVSAVLAKVHEEDSSSWGEIERLVLSEDELRQEVGLYAVKLIWTRHPNLIDLELLAEAVELSVTARGRVAEMLLNLALGGLDVRNLVSSERFWNPPWEYTRALVEDTRAAVEYFGKRSADAPREAVQAMEAAERDRIRLREELDDPTLRGLLTDYWKLQLNLESLQAAAPALARRGHVGPLIALLLAHPAWEVREGAASVAAGLDRPELRTLAVRLLDDPNWRVRYAAVDLAYFSAPLDEGAAFKAAVARGRADRHAWIRGVTANTLASWIKDAPPGLGRGRLEEFSEEVKALAADSDLWPVEEMYDFLAELRRRGEDVSAYLPEPRWLDRPWTEIYADLESRITGKRP